ncbi:hypothetical protein PODOV044v1_p0003 [Vibrio phage 23E28.1]|nr:hypothetical protein PODOV044v1_p0003 [Vibrio phage 23E28.1]QZI92088.1 hypothetical protein PODOV045v1_p0046 [Vibrio phage 69E27.1]
MSELSPLSQETEKTATLPIGSNVNIWELLEPNKQIMAIEYAMTGSYSAAAKKAGVEPRTARKWGKDARVMALVKHQLDQLAQVSLVSPLMLERMALDIFDVAMAKEETCTIDKEGGTHEEKLHNLPAANQAIATLHRIQSDREKISVEKDKAKGGQTVILKIEQANFNSNQHFDMLKNATSTDVSTVEEGVIIDG